MGQCLQSYTILLKMAKLNLKKYFYVKFPIPLTEKQNMSPVTLMHETINRTVRQRIINQFIYRECNLDRQYKLYIHSKSLKKRFVMHYCTVERNIKSIETKTHTFHSICSSNRLPKVSSISITALYIL